MNISEENYNTWYDNCLEEKSHLSWIKNIYWKLDVISCVLVLRNKKWFNAVKDKFIDIWETIIREKKTGYEHRKPKKRVKKKIEHVLKIETQIFTPLNI